MAHDLPGKIEFQLSSFNTTEKLAILISSKSW